jgi:hypothetical protein
LKDIRTKIGERGERERERERERGERGEREREGKFEIVTSSST